MKRILSYLIACVCTLSLCTSCGIYSFTGTSIQADVKSITINYFQYKALKVNPSLQTQITEALKEKFVRFTRLDLVDETGDLEVSGEIVGYEVRASGVSSNEVATTNRLTITAKVTFVNKKYPDENFEKPFSAYADYNSEQSLDAVESSLCDYIVETMVEDIFTACVANW